MRINPYEPQQLAIDKSHRTSADALRHRICLVSILGGLFAFGLGIVWLKLLHGTPTEINPVHYVLAQLVAFGGMAIAIVAFVARTGALVSRLSTRFTDDGVTVFGWNTVPAAFSFLIGAGWFGLGSLGLYTVVREVENWNLDRGSPVLELVLQSLLFGSGVAASACCLIAGRQWMKRNYARAFLHSAIGILGPIVAYVLLFKVCEDVIRYLV